MMKGNHSSALLRDPPGTLFCLNEKQHRKRKRYTHTHTYYVCSCRTRHISGQSETISDKELMQVDKLMAEISVYNMQEPTQVCTPIYCVWRGDTIPSAYILRSEVDDLKVLCLNFWYEWFQIGLCNLDYHIVCKLQKETFLWLRENQTHLYYCLFKCCFSPLEINVY